MSDLKEIFLQPECCADPHDGRLWCKDDAPTECEDENGNEIPWTRYVLASDYDALAAEVLALKADLASMTATMLAMREQRERYADERDALHKDAERYRWLRDSAGNDIMEKLMAECSPPRWDELVDAAIDAAMGERP